MVLELSGLMKAAEEYDPSGKWSARADETVWRLNDVDQDIKAFVLPEIADVVRSCANVHYNDYGMDGNLFTVSWGIVHVIGNEIVCLQEVSYEVSC